MRISVLNKTTIYYAHANADSFRKSNDYGTRIPYREVEALARVLLLEIQWFFKSEERQREYAGKPSRKSNNTNRHGKGGNISTDAPATCDTKCSMP